jgi:hypothetical protein
VTQIESDLEDSLRAVEAASVQGAKRIQELAAAGQILAHRITIAIAVALLSAILATVAIVPALIHRNYSLTISTAGEVLGKIGDSRKFY